MDEAATLLEKHRTRVKKDQQKGRIRRQGVQKMRKKLGTKKTPESMGLLWESFVDLMALESQSDARVRRYMQQDRLLSARVQEISAQLKKDEIRLRQYERTVMTEALKGMKCNPHFGTRTKVSGVGVFG